MAAPQVDRLRGIKTLPQLLAYLRDELDWPIDSDDAESVTFDYEPSELGLDEKSVVRVKEIKQLRPLSGNQPWGIFFVNFEKKRLPVMLMRRVLRSLVFKKRTSPGKSDRQAWHANDLLFISAYGEEHDRAITFAHFVEDQELGGLAELRVLGWDDDDTPLKYEYIAHTLRKKLSWRAEFEGNQDEWRKVWRDAFELRHREVITTSKQLASKLAELAKKIRARVRSVLHYEDGSGQVRKLQAAFRKALIHDLSDDDFADMYAQTITYGLFSAAVSPSAGTHGENIIDIVPPTNPFLRDMLKTFLNLSGRKGKIDFDELGIQEVMALLNSPSTHLDAVLRDFGNRTRDEDPVIHFYEDFLREYDAKKKIQRGVFYTPQPVVSYIVRSVHELLRTEFGLEDGLADTTTWGEIAKKCADLKIPEGVKPDQSFVQILDPATGTATFLVEVVDVIYEHLKNKWQKGGLKAMPALPATSFPRQASEFSEYWNRYVALALLPRLHGYELMMAPYAIAHMKIGLKLFETGYRFGSGERARIYLANALEPPTDLAEQPEFEAWAPALAHEAKAVNSIKRHQRFTVVIGNPPYSSAASSPDTSILIDRYMTGLGVENERKKGALQDEYIRFFALSQATLEASSTGVLGLITNNSYLDGTLHRAMRKSLLSMFRILNVLNLHGSSRVAQKGVVDENVFDIKQGVAVCTGLTSGVGAPNQQYCRYADLLGTRTDKYHKLQQHVSGYGDIHPVAPYFLLRPLDTTLYQEYGSFIGITDVFETYSSGIETEKDHFAVGFDAAELKQRLIEFCDLRVTDKQIAGKFDLKDTPNWNVHQSRRVLSKEGLKSSSFVRYLFHCFDWRYTYYSDWLITRSRKPVMRNMNRKNLALVCLRQVKGEAWAHAFVSADITNKFTLSSKSSNVSYHFPLFLLSADEPSREFFDGSLASINLKSEWLREFNLRFVVEDGGRDIERVASRVFAYFYAVLYSIQFRSRYAQYLCLDFPRVPLTANLELFGALARLGEELVSLHLLESPKLDKARTEFIGGRNPEIEKMSWSKNTVWIDKAQITGFKGVPEAVWNFNIGGYQVCEKWLKDRKGRTISKDDIAHYYKIVVALAETIRLMQEIDKVIEKHGGWPSAFAANRSAER